ncbi:hypothetical protein [Paraburkholderia bannensis]|uniref:hypothetical protein n=1 Tax=Paraburkholderia bannensis TaxID=765414 RepID=UPI002ABD8AE9|nr:hypothetical protein [Paraburkholderia bannensis]
MAANYGRLMREGDFSPDAALATLDAIAKQRTAEARIADPAIITYIPASVSRASTPRWASTTSIWPNIC